MVTPDRKVKKLILASELQPKPLFEWLCEKYPGEYEEGQLRTFERRVKEWKAKNGPDKELYFPQKHNPGERMATDWTHADSLGVTVNGKPFSHLLCHVVLTYSNWECVTICHSESLLSLRHGVQTALFKLGHVDHCLEKDFCSNRAGRLPAPRTAGTVCRYSST